MNESGKDLLTVLDKVRGLFEEMSRLLSTADSAMQESGWKSLKGSTVTSTMSYSIYGPRQWMPHFLCRFYERESAPHLLPCISIQLGVLEADYRDLLTEPLILASLYDYGTGNKVENWDYQYCNWALWSQHRKDDGTVFKTNLKKEWPTWECAAIGLSAFALPLMTINDASSLKERVVLPLCKLA